MDEMLFDRLIKSLAVGASRRNAVRAICGLLAAGLGRLGNSEMIENAQAICLPGEACNCAPVGASCSRDGQCCSDLCLNNGKCGCGSVGAPCSKDKNCCAGATCDRGACVPITDYQFLRAWDAPFVRGVAVDAASRVYATVGDALVQKFTSQGDLLTTWGSEGSGDGEFELTCDIAVDHLAPPPGRVYVTDTYNYRVQAFTGDGDFVFWWGGTQGGGDGEFHEACGIAVDAKHNIYVVDWGEGNHRVQKFNPRVRGGFITSWGGFGSGNGEFQYPRGVAVHWSKVYVADGANYRVQQFSTNGAFQLAWGGKGSGNGQFNFPWGVATDQAGNVYVSDHLNHRIQKFTDGAYVAKWGTKGSGDGQFNEPHGVAVDLSGRVYVADWGNNRIQVFKPA